MNAAHEPSAKSCLIRNARKALEGSLERCTICPRRCGVNRAASKKGYCRAGSLPRIYSYAPHHGEEPTISGSRGSGTIFFSSCNMKCAYCQNYLFSQLDEGEEVSTGRLAGMMLELQALGCHNINFVNPTHFVPQILSALDEAYAKGLSVPLVYNTSGYDSIDTLRLLAGIVDIYLPDMRYARDEIAKKYSDAGDYVRINRAAIGEMHRQVGDAVITDGVALRGLIIRLLVLPEDASGTVDTLRFIRNEISKNAFLSIMSQYYPTYKAYAFGELSRRVALHEYQNVLDEAQHLGLNNGWIQEMPDPDDTSFFGTNITPDNEIIR